MNKTAIEIQAEYYKQTATQYDTSHIDSTNDIEHDFALSILSSMIQFYSVKSILDVGAGTGRTIKYIMEKHPDVRIIGIEPILELREQGYSKGISKSILIEGDGNNIMFKEQEFDLVCEFAVLHHVAKPKLMVDEMLRVSSKCIFISDSNNFGQGSNFERFLKQSIDFLGLWRLYDIIRTKGKGYHISDGDGLYYSYSVFNNYSQIKRHCKKIHLINTGNGEVNLYKSAPHVVLAGIK